MALKTTILLLLLYLLPVAGMNQSMSADADKVMRPLQVTLLPPIGSNGIEAHKISNNISINIIGGYNGGLTGFEFGSFANVIKNDITGVQTAGFTNIVMGRARAVQLAGFLNLTGRSMLGLQASGFANIALKNMKGPQLAGFTNISLGNVLGPQFAGFGNVVAGNFKGVQTAGFINITKGNVDGFQIGLFNFSDTINHGAPIGFFSYVKSGYHSFTVDVNESFYGNVTFRTGVYSLYNILSIGATFRGDKFFWAYGHGMGTQILINQDWHMNIEGLTYLVNEDELWTNELNLMYRFTIDIGWRFSENTTIVFGPGYSILVSKLRNSDGDLVGSELPSYTTYSKAGNNVYTQMFPGFNIGLRF